MFQRLLILIVCGLFTVAMVVYAARSSRRGGYGPPIKFPALTRAGRFRTNRSYEKHGWAKPYDDDGNLLPRRQRTLPHGADRVSG